MDSKTTRLRMKLAYDGSDFIGWQKQPKDPNSIQGLLERTVEQIYRQPISLIASGRTDRGVHALGQWVHGDFPDDDRLLDLPYKLNRMTPNSLSVLKVERAPEDFHAQISALTKCYKYRISMRNPPSPFRQAYSWTIKNTLNLNRLNDMAEVFWGEHDFTSFQSKGTPVSSPVRKILLSRWISLRPGLIEYQIKGNGFLKQMVRNMVGTMVKLEQFQGPRSEITRVLAGRDRQLAAAPAPPQGLFLTSVQYPSTLDNKCRKL